MAVSRRVAPPSSVDGYEVVVRRVVISVATRCRLSKDAQADLEQTLYLYLMEGLITRIDRSLATDMQWGFVIRSLHGKAQHWLRDEFPLVPVPRREYAEGVRSLCGSLDEVTPAGETILEGLIDPGLDVADEVVGRLSLPLWLEAAKLSPGEEGAIRKQATGVKLAQGEHTHLTRARNKLRRSRHVVFATA